MLLLLLLLYYNFSGWKRHRVFGMRMWNHLFAAPNYNYDHKQQTLKNTKQKPIKIPVGGGGDFRNFWVGMCH